MHPFIQVVSIIFVIGFLWQPVSCQVDGDIRLVNGPTSEEGRVEIYHNAEWGTISSTSVLNDISAVVCRQLGLPHNAALQFGLDSPYGQGTGQSWVASVMCEGTESKLTECQFFKWTMFSSLLDFQTHLFDIGVACKGESSTSEQEPVDSGAIRLMDGTAENRGRLEVWRQDGWATVCSEDFTVTEATVACRQLGLDTSAPFVYSDAFFGSDVYLDGPVYADCKGDETKLSHCIDYNLSNQAGYYCGHAQDVSICCGSADDSSKCMETSASSTTGIIVGVVIIAGILLAVSCCCYCCCCRQKKPATRTKQYTTVTQVPPAQPGVPEQYPMAQKDGSSVPVYYHGAPAAPPHPSGSVAAMPAAPAAPVQQPYPPQQYPQYPVSGDASAPPPGPAASYPYPTPPAPGHPDAYPPQPQPGYNSSYPTPDTAAGYPPAAAAGPYPPPQPATSPYPPSQTGSHSGPDPTMPPPYHSPYMVPGSQNVNYPTAGSTTSESYPTKGDSDHQLPPGMSPATASAPPMD